MNVTRIKDYESLKAWLNARPEGAGEADAITIAQRSACRLLPPKAQHVNPSKANDNYYSDLVYFRPALALGVARLYSEHEVKAASDAAGATVTTAFIANLATVSDVAAASRNIAQNTDFANIWLQSSASSVDV